MPDEDLDAAEQLCRRLGPVNCWNGTGGAIASAAMAMIRELRERRMADEQVEKLHAGEELLREALLTIRQRRKTYGPATEHFSRTVGAINAIFASKLREPLTVADWAQIMILDKLSRHQERRHRDNLVDAAGYSACWAECEEAEG